MKDYGIVKSIKNDNVKVELDTGEVIFRRTELFTPADRVTVGDVVLLNGYELIIDNKETEKRRIARLTNKRKLFKRKRGN